MVVGVVMNISEAVQYLGADKYVLKDTPIKCDAKGCAVKRKTIYRVYLEDDDVIIICGKCLVKYAKSYKEYVDQGGCCSFG